MDLHDILEKVKNGEIAISDAEKQIKLSPYEEMDFAKLDMHRQLRQGQAEVVYCSGKADEYLLQIFNKLYEQNGEVLGTRASRAQYDYLKAHINQVTYDEEARILKIDKAGIKEKRGKIVVCTAGTADIPVAKEAVLTAEFFGNNVVTLYDVGVSGIHRLLSNMDSFIDANCVIAVAGMEGALAGVVGGLVSCPVIAVPTSVGYGANFGGLSALMTMINSCSNGVSVVNIDNGFGAAFIASMINHQATRDVKTC